MLSGGVGLDDVLDPLPHRFPAPTARSGPSPHPRCESKQKLLESKFVYLVIHCVDVSNMELLIR